MAIRKYRKLTILTKIETTYGTDAVPTGAANAMQMTNVTVTPIDGDEVSRDLMLPYLGNPGVSLAGAYGKIEGEVEIAGSGTVGTAPAWGPLMRACGLAEVTSAGASVSYSPVSSGEEAASLYWNADGVRHVLLGLRGNVSMSFEPKKFPRWKFSLMGLLGTITDAALPTAVLTGFKRPVLVSKANTTLSLFGAARIAEKVDLDFGQKVETRFLIGSESMEITDRSASGTIVVQAQSIATVDWFTKSLSEPRERGALSLVHGTVAGNIVEIAAPALEIGKVGQGQTQGILNYSLPVIACPVAGNDEMVITVR